MAYQKDQPNTDWLSKEKREMFRTVVNSFIIKSGSDKDPIMDKILPIAEQVVNRAFEIYPDKNEDGEEKPL